MIQHQPFYFLRYLIATAKHVFNVEIYARTCGNHFISTDQNFVTLSEANETKQ